MRRRYVGAELRSLRITGGELNPTTSYVAERQLILARLYKAGRPVAVVLVAAATVDNEWQNQPSLPRLEMDALFVPALKSRAKLTWSLRDREDGCCIYFSKTIIRRLHSYFRKARHETNQTTSCD